MLHRTSECVHSRIVTCLKSQSGSSLDSLKGHLEGGEESSGRSDFYKAFPPALSFIVTWGCQEQFDIFQNSLTQNTGNWILKSSERRGFESRWAARLMFLHTRAHVENIGVWAGFPNSGWATLLVTPDVCRKNLLQASHLFNSKVMAEIHHTRTHLSFIKSVRFRPQPVGAE